MRDKFLENNDIVRGSSIGEKASLIGANDIRKHVLNSVENDLGDQLRWYFKTRLV